MISFSRGAWLNGAVAVVALGYLALLAAPSNRRRVRFLFLGLFSLVVASCVIVWGVQMSQVNTRLEERAGLALSYDLSRDGRFSGHRRALDTILEHDVAFQRSDRGKSPAGAASSLVFHRRQALIAPVEGIRNVFGRHHFDNLGALGPFGWLLQPGQFLH